MQKNQYYQHKKHCQYFSLYWSSDIAQYISEMKMQQGASERRVYKREAHTQATSNDAASSFPMGIYKHEARTQAMSNEAATSFPMNIKPVCIVASKRGVHKHAVKRNFAKRRLRATLRSFLKTESLPVVKLRIVAKKEILSCSFADLNFMIHQSLKAI